MNHMKELAQMLGVELNEEFNIKGFSYKKYKITKDGVFISYEEDNKWYKVCDAVIDILMGKYEIIKQPVLDEAEREYLRNIIKPFRDKVKTIIRLDFYWTSAYIQIEYDRDLEQIILKSDKMYNNMKLGKEYSLEELGL